MPTTLLFVETKPASPERAGEYHAWQEHTHIPEMLRVDGFVAARRWRADDGESFITLYEIDTDIETARTNLKAAVQAGSGSGRDEVAADQRPGVSRAAPAPWRTRVMMRTTTSGASPHPPPRRRGVRKAPEHPRVLVRDGPVRCGRGPGGTTA